MKFRIKAKLLPDKEINSAYASLEATVQGPSRRSISNRIQSLVHRGEFYIGLQPSTTFLPKGEDLSVRVITVKPDGQMDPGKKIRVKLIRREWHSIRKAGVGGRYRWISEKVDTDIDDQSVKTKDESQQVIFSPEKAGFYLLEQAQHIPMQVFMYPNWTVGKAVNFFQNDVIVIKTSQNHPSR